MRFLCNLTKLLGNFSVFPCVISMPGEQKSHAAAANYQHCRRENPFKPSSEKQGSDGCQTDEIAKSSQKKYQQPPMLDFSVRQSASQCGSKK